MELKTQGCLPFEKVFSYWIHTMRKMHQKEGGSLCLLLVCFY